jgi:multidrug efflux pump
MTSINLVAIPICGLGEFSELVLARGERRHRALKDIAEIDLGAENYDSDVRFSGQKATFMGIWVLPTANSLDVIKAVRAQFRTSRNSSPPG